jgi:hypothetical protein
MGEARMNRRAKLSSSLPLLFLFAGSLGRAVDAAEVRVQGQAVIYKAKVGEVNRVVVRSIPASGDPSGVLIAGVEITDTAPLFGLGGCRPNGPDAVLCEIDNPLFVELDLGNKDDEVRQVEVATPFSVPMRVSGGLGNDLITGGFAADVLDGGAGEDTIDGSDGDDVLHGSAGRDTIRGGRGADRIDGDSGDDLLLDGGGGDDEVRGGLGGDTLTGGPGRDRLFGGAGGDRLNSRDGEVDDLDCGSGNDEVDRDAADTTRSCGR